MMELYKKNKRNGTILIVLIAGLLLPGIPLRAQLRFAVDSLCIVSDPEHSLDAFFSELDRLAAGADTVVSVVHLGDSHIQAGFYPGKVMRLLQDRYGNAGRGWIAPFKLSKTNEPNDYFIHSIVRDWTSGRATQSLPKTAIGPGGIGLHTISHFANFDLIIAPNNGAGYRFNQAVLYRGEESMPMIPAGSSKETAERIKGASYPSLGIRTDTFRIGYLADTLQLQSTRRKEGTDELIHGGEFNNSYYGFNLTNGSPGILYHSVGLNGAMFVNYTRPEFVKQLALFKPSLLIISLGTNESFGRRFSKAEFAGQVNDFLSLVEQYLPGTALLLTTPAECYKRVWVDKKRTYARNANVEYVAETLQSVANKKGIACWNLFEATGGKNSYRNWYNGKWMGRDRIHFTREGYEEQGTLLFNALMNLKTERESTND